MDVARRFYKDAGKGTARLGGRTKSEKVPIVLFYTVVDVATALQVSKRTVRRWIDNGELIAHKLGGMVRIADDDLCAFLVRRRCNLK